MGEQQSICNEQWVKFKPLDNRRVLKDYGCFDSKVVKFPHQNMIEDEVQGMYKLLRFIRIWKVEQLWIQKIKKPYILKNLINIDFTYLKVLCLSKDTITSLNSIHKLEAPHLSKLYFSYNLVNKINSLHRCYFPKLTEISLSKHFMKEGNNKIVDMEKLTQLSSEKLSTLVIQFYRHPEQCPNILWLVKLQTMKLSVLRIQSPDRIKDKNVKKMIYKKHHNTRVYEKYN